MASGLCASRYSVQVSTLPVVSCPATSIDSRSSRSCCALTWHAPHVRASLAGLGTQTQQAHAMHLRQRPMAGVHGAHASTRSVLFNVLGASPHKLWGQARAAVRLVAMGVCDTNAEQKREPARTSLREAIRKRSTLGSAVFMYPSSNAACAQNHASQPHHQSML